MAQAINYTIETISFVTEEADSKAASIDFVAKSIDSVAGQT